MEKCIRATPVLQVFCGKSVLPEWRCPDHTKIEELRNRLAPETHRAIGDYVLRVAHDFGFADASWMDVDSTVQEANISYPADSILMKKLCEKAHHVLRFLKEKKKAYVAQRLRINIAQEAALERYGPGRRFSAKDVCELHRLWLGPIYPWAGKYRTINIGKGGFQFAHAPLIPRLERGPLRRCTPCRQTGTEAVAHALAEAHAELILVHPFRDGNGRLTRLLALQADLPPLDFSPFAGRGKRAYIAAIHAAMSAHYAPLERLFLRIIDRSQRLAASNRR